MIAEVGLIHMNGRVYDPEIGRFTSADSIIQAPNSLQSYNRYSYVFNNPLSFTDPSGHLTTTQKVQIVAAVAVIAMTGGAASAAVAQGYGMGVAMGITMAGGYMAGYIASNGNQQAALQGAVFAFMTFGIGQAMIAPDGMSSIAGVFAHGMLGGAQSTAAGSSFRSGFISGAFTKAATIGGPLALTSGEGMGYYIAETIKGALLGGTAAELAGGKFANGALSGAMGRMFNAVISAEARSKYGEYVKGSLERDGGWKLEGGVRRASLSVDSHGRVRASAPFVSADFSDFGRSLESLGVDVIGAKLTLSNFTSNTVSWELEYTARITIFGVDTGLSWTTSIGGAVVVNPAHYLVNTPAGNIYQYGVGNSFLLRQYEQNGWDHP